MDRRPVTMARLDAAIARLRAQTPPARHSLHGREWAWHVIDIRLPRTIAPDAVPHTPALRPTRAGRMAVGFDGGVNTLLTGTLGRLTGKGQTWRVVTAGRPLVFGRHPGPAASVRTGRRTTREPSRKVRTGLWPRSAAMIRRPPLTGCAVCASTLVGRAIQSEVHSPPR